MPKLSGNAVGDAKLLVKAYKALCFKHYGKRPRLAKDSHFRMRRAAQAMRDHGVLSPFGWASFRLFNWKHSERAKDRPSLDYVFSANVVEKHREHYSRRRSSHHVNDQRHMTASHQELVRLWEKCKNACGSPKAGEVGETGTRAIVERVLPESVYQDLASRIAEERRVMEAGYYQRLAKGEWIW